MSREVGCDTAPGPETKTMEEIDAFSEATFSPGQLSPRPPIGAGDAAAGTPDCHSLALSGSSAGPSCDYPCGGRSASVGAETAAHPGADAHGVRAACGDGRGVIQCDGKASTPSCHKIDLLVIQ